MIGDAWHWITANVGVILLYLFVALLYIVVYYMWKFPGEFDDSHYDDPGDISPADRVRKYRRDSDKNAGEQGR